MSSESSKSSTFVAPKPNEGIISKPVTKKVEPVPFHGMDFRGLYAECVLIEEGFVEKIESIYKQLEPTGFIPESYSLFGKQLATSVMYSLVRPMISVYEKTLYQEGDDFDDSLKNAFKKTKLFTDSTEDFIANYVKHVFTELSGNALRKEFTQRYNEVREEFDGTNLNKLLETEHERRMNIVAKLGLDDFNGLAAPLREVYVMFMGGLSNGWVSKSSYRKALRVAAKEVRRNVKDKDPELLRYIGHVHSFLADVNERLKEFKASDGCSSKDLDANAEFIVDSLRNKLSDEVKRDVMEIIDANKYNLDDPCTPEPCSYWFRRFAKYSIGLLGASLILSTIIKTAQAFLPKGYIVFKRYDLDGNGTFETHRVFYTDVGPDYPCESPWELLFEFKGSQYNSSIGIFQRLDRTFPESSDTASIDLVYSHFDGFEHLFDVTMNNLNLVNFNGPLSLDDMTAFSDGELVKLFDPLNRIYMGLGGLEVDSRIGYWKIWGICDAEFFATNPDFDYLEEPNLLAIPIAALTTAGIAGLIYLIFKKKKRKPEKLGKTKKIKKTKKDKNQGTDRWDDEWD